MGIIAWIVLGLIAGFIASKIVNHSGSGVIMDIVLGVIGAIAGGLVFSFFGAVGVTGFNLYSLLVAVVGAVLVLWIYHAIAGRRRKEHRGLVAGGRRTGRLAMKLTLDLHDIYNRGGDIDRALRGVIDEAIEKKVRLVEIIPGKGSGQLKKRVLRFLDQKEIKTLYDRVEKDSKNFGRVFVHFRHR